jgi:Zn-finger nucleic acid-binding protein
MSVAGFDYSYRCEKCGGVWMANWVVNNLASGKPVQVQPLKASVVSRLGGNVCPTDGARLVTPARGTVPEGLVVEKCSQCGWWWFPGDELFKFADAFKTKVAYVRVWERREWFVYAWPALVLVLMVMGLTASVSLVKNRQSTAINAGVGISEFVSIPWGEGRLEVRFKSDSVVNTIDYRQKGSGERVGVPVKLDGDVYQAVIEGLEPGEYVVAILDREFTVQVK